MALAIIFESVGVGEWLVLLAVVLVVVGPKNLPSTARKFGQYYSKFRRAADGFKRQLMEMDTEFTNAVAEAERAVDTAANDIEKAADDVSSGLTPPDPSEYGGYEDYADYGNYDPAGPSDSASEASAQPAEAPQAAEEPAKPVAKPAGGIKITVSPAPQSADGAKAKA